MRALGKCLLVSLATLVAFGCDESGPDNTFDVSVQSPALTARRPSVLFDEAHNNYHTTGGRYRPFVRLITNDGCKVTASTSLFSPSVLKEQDILVIAGARGKNEQGSNPAFTEGECLSVAEWVQNGGSLLLITDHYPFGMAAQNLAKKFGVMLGDGGVEDSLHFDTSTRVDWTQLVFSRANGLLFAEHPICEGRDPTEQVKRVVTFWGQSVSVPEGADAILRLSEAARDVHPIVRVEKDGSDTRTIVEYGNPTSAAGRAQGIAMRFGEGRVVVLGEAAMLTAQIDRDGNKFGMNLPGSSNRQFALNVVRWLAGAL